MKQIGISYLSIVVTVLLSCCLCNSEIIEKNAKRYFKLAEKEYVCNSDNRISDNSAGDILQTVRKIYQSSSYRQDYVDAIDDVWENMHKVYTGEIYDETLFLCLKYKINGMLRGLAPVDGGFHKVKYDKKEQYIRRCYLGEKFLVITYDNLNGGRKTNLYYHRGYPVKSYLYYLFYEIMGEKKSTHVSPDSFNGALDGNPLGIIDIHFYQNRFAHIEKLYIVKACDTFVGRINDMLVYFSDRAGSKSFIFDSQWDELLLNIPKVILKTVEGKNKEKDYDEYTHLLLSVRAIENSLSQCLLDNTRQELIQIARKNSLKIKIPEPKIESKPLL